MRELKRQGAGRDGGGEGQGRVRVGCRGHGEFLESGVHDTYKKKVTNYVCTNDKYAVTSCNDMRPVTNDIASHELLHWSHTS